MGVNLDNWVRIQWTSKKKAGAPIKRTNQKIRKSTKLEMEKTSSFQIWKNIYDEIFQIAKDKIHSQHMERSFLNIKVIGVRNKELYTTKIG